MAKRNDAKHFSGFITASAKAFRQGNPSCSIAAALTTEPS